MHFFVATSFSPAAPGKYFDYIYIIRRWMTEDTVYRAVRCWLTFDSEMMNLAYTSIEKAS